MTAHISDFVILADINKFPKAMQGHNRLREMAQIVTRNTVSELNVSERKHFPDNRGAACQHWLVTMPRCAQTCVQILRPIHPVCTVCVFVSILSLLYFFSLLLCLSVCQAICVYFPFVATCLLPPHPLPMLFTEMTPVWKYFTLFCAFPGFTDFYFFLMRDALS